MFNLLLVDDKKDIVNGIASAVDWNARGVEVFCFYNGKDALAQILTNPPDMVITDIKMPFLTGLELVRKASVVHPEIRFIVLTGYDEFAYAREALHLGVVEYLSKPIRIEVIEQLVLNEKIRLTEQNKKKRDITDIRIKFNQSLPFMKSKWFQSFINDKKVIQREILNEQFMEMEIALADSYFTVVLIERDIGFETTKVDQQSENKLLIYAIENMAKELIGRTRPCEAFQCNENRLAILINYDPQQNAIVNHYELYSQLTSLHKLFNEYFEATISIGMGQCYEDIEGIYQSYDEAAQALAHKFYFGNNSIISIYDIANGKVNNKIQYPKEMEESMIQLIKQADHHRMINELELYFERLKQMKSLPPAKMRETMISFILRISSECSVKPQTNIMELLDGFRELKTLVDMAEWFRNYTKQLCDLQDTENTSIKKEILKVKTYIDQHYQETITLKKMADYIFISQSYLSFTFKEIMKVNFNEYLTKVRMEHAKELIQSSKYKIYEVCEMVGYTDKKHFSDLFKKHTGVLPKQWNRKDSNNE